ncbi:hypothetical protein AAY473_022797 [Plecturocebus cupreus]
MPLHSSLGSPFVTQPVVQWCDHSSLQPQTPRLKRWGFTMMARLHIRSNPFQPVLLSQAEGVSAFQQFLFLSAILQTQEFLLVVVFFNSLGHSFTGIFLRFKDGMYDSRVQWLTPVIPALWEAAAGGSLEPKSLRPAWATYNMDAAGSHYPKQINAGTENQTRSHSVSQAGVQWCVILAHCNLHLLGSGDPPNSASQVVATTSVCHHAQLIFVFLVEMGFCHVAQADLKLLGSRFPSTSASQSAEITGMSHCAWPRRPLKAKPWKLYNPRKANRSLFSALSNLHYGLHQISALERIWKDINPNFIQWGFPHATLSESSPGFVGTASRQGLTMLVRLVLNSQPQVIRLPWPPKCLDYQREPPRPTKNFGKLKWVDHLRSGIQDQPSQHSEIPSLLKIQKLAGGSDGVSLCCPDCSAMVLSQLTVTFACQVQAILLTQLRLQACTTTPR